MESSIAPNDTPPTGSDDHPYVHSSLGNQPSADQTLLQSKAAVLAILFVGTGALGIPLLWMNQRFSNKERWFWAAIATIYSLSLLLFLGWFIYWLKAKVMG